MSDDVTVEYVFEYWDCPHCGQKEIRGDVLTCAACGTPRNQNIRFYRKEAHEELVTEQRQQEKFEAGPDWKCSFCTTLNPSLDSACRGCGHTRDESDQNYFEMTEKADAAQTTNPAAAKGQPSPWRRRILLALCAAASLILLVWCWASRTHQVEYRVSSMKWERAIPHLRYQWVEREDWVSDIQGEAVKRLSERPEIHHYEKRMVGTRTESYMDTERVSAGTRQECSSSYSSTGSGASRKTTTCRNVPQYTTRSVRRTRVVPVYRDFPVMATKVRYKSKSYAPLTVEKLSGSDPAPRWPELKLAKGLDDKPDKEGTRAESYSVELTKESAEAKGPERLIALPDSAHFQKDFAVGKRISLAISNSGSVTPPYPELKVEAPKNK